MRSFKALRDVRRLAKISDAWGQVYKTYLLCVSLLVLITIIKSVVDFMIAGMIILTIAVGLMVLYVSTRYITIHHTLLRNS